MMDSSYKYVSDTKSSYKRGIDFQREAFKAAKHSNDYDSMCDALENIKSEIKTKLIKGKRKKTLIRIEDILNWYRTKEKQYIKNTEDGPTLILPPDINFKVNKNLTVAYELLIGELSQLDLL